MKRYALYWRESPNHRWKLAQALAVGTTKDQAESHAARIEQKLKDNGRRRAEVKYSNTIL